MMKRNTWLLIICAAVTLILIIAGTYLLNARLGYGNNMMRGNGMMGGYGTMGMMAGGLGMLLFWSLVIGGTVWLVLGIARSQQPNLIAPAGQAPLDVLKRRYAAGEINKEQFDEIRKGLE